MCHADYAGSTQPGDGAAVHVLGAPSWKEKFIGYAKKTRGTMLRKVRVWIWPPLPHPILISVGAIWGSLKLRSTERRSSKAELPLATRIRSRIGAAIPNEGYRTPTLIPSSPKIMPVIMPYYTTNVTQTHSVWGPR